jgi:hypothetical protein
MDQAFDQLNTAVENKIYPIAYIDQMPGVESIKDDPRYPKLLENMNLPVLDGKKKSLTAGLTNPVPPTRLAMVEKQY